MKRFKKIGCIVAAICCSVGFASCEKKDGEPKGPLTKETWENMLAITNFDNVTFECSVLYLNGERQNEEIYEGYKFANNAAAFYENTSEDVLLSVVEMGRIRSLYVNSLLEILGNFDDYTFNEEKGGYDSLVSMAPTLSTMEEDMLVTVENVHVTIYENGLLETLTCNVKQTFTEDEEMSEYQLFVSMYFFDYGTTEILSDGEESSEKEDEKESSSESAEESA